MNKTLDFTVLPQCATSRPHANSCLNWQ